MRFARRAAVSSFGLALGAALVTALATGATASALLRRAEDRRLTEAAMLFAGELTNPTATADELSAAVDEEERETTHAGLVFSVFSSSATRLAGDSRPQFVAAGTCEFALADLRACAVASGPFVVLAGAAWSDDTPVLLLAALLAALLTAIIAWFVSRPLAASVVSPLTQLQADLAKLDAAQKLGQAPPSGITEIDALRETIAALLTRLDSALAQATRFAADAAHELRTPLSTLQAELELNPTQLDAARATVARLSLLVERVLVLATPGASGATELVSLRDVVEDVHERLLPAERERVAVQIDGELSVQGDVALLTIMVSNAISNALKFGKRVTVHSRDDGVWFDDDGPGVPVAERERVFEPLFRGAAAREARVAGHGLGLALIAHVARRHGLSARFVEGAVGARLSIVRSG